MYGVHSRCGGYSPFPTVFFGLSSAVFWVSASFSSLEGLFFGDTACKGKELAATSSVSWSIFSSSIELFVSGGESFIVRGFDMELHAYDG